MRGRALSIRARWFVLMGVLATAIIVASVVIAVVVARFHLYAVASDESLARARAFAFRAGFAVLVGADDRATVDMLLEEITHTGDAMGVQLVREDRVVLGMLEKKTGAIAACRFRDGHGEPTVMAAGGSWCVSVPVVVGERERQSRRVVGELRIVSSMQAVHSMANRMVSWLALVGVVLLTAAWFAIWRSAAGITHALMGVVRTMRLFGPGRAAPRAPIEGPEEIRTIANVYNALLEDVGRHEQRLEDQVLRRTQELNEALARVRNAERYKSVFMATVSHEMKTPLYVVDAHARDVLGELEFVPAASAARAHVEVILRETEELTMRLGQMLDLSRAESTQSDPARARIGLRALADAIREKTEPLARRQNNVLELDVADDSLESDPDLLGQVVANLVTNACKFTQGGRVCLRMAVLANVLEIDVRDTGRGIPKQVLAMIFEEFWQADSGEGRRVGGFGLGLAIVKRCVERLRGTVHVESEVGVGTRMSVRIPV